MRSLETIRGEIDSIDDQLASLIKKRTALSDEVALSKRESGRCIGDPARERNIMTRVTENADPHSERALRLVFSTLFGMSRARQREKLIGETELSRRIDAARQEAFPKRAVVACAGIEGSFAQQATSLIFPIPTIIYFNGFEKVFEAVERSVQREKLLEQIQDILSEREYTVICLRYALKGGVPLPQREVANLLKISRSYISRIEKHAIDKLRTKLHAEDFLD